jgi:flavorubredoxin/flavin reductase (DIM6/NTAB) family NADH-FMN oxidoreductase RutF
VNEKLRKTMILPKNKSKDIQITNIAADTQVLRSRLWDRLRFEIEYALQKGTTANSYLIRGEKTALIDPPGERFTEIFITALKEQIEIEKLDYVILGHTNPNRSVTLKSLLEINPRINFVCSNPAAISLRKLFPELKLNIAVVKGEETLNLGRGHNLEFILTPNPRYPDLLCTYDPQTEVLYTNKLFGAHICSEQVFEEVGTVCNEDRRYYFDCLMAPYTRQVQVALDKISTKKTQIYAPGHGTLVRNGLNKLTSHYREWLKQLNTQELRVALIYASAYGNTATIGQAIAKGITKAGVAVETLDVESAGSDEIKAAIEKSDGFIIGSPTLGGGAPTLVQAALGIALANADRTKLAGVFGSYGWSGEAIDAIESRLQEAGYNFGFETIRVKFKPTDVTLKYCEEAGTDFAQAIKKAKKARQTKPFAKTSATDTTELALGKIIGPLCVLTTKQENITGGMLASWVSQATFNPPGLTIAVAKERAIESLLYIGDTFAVNVLSEGDRSGLMKHFVKSFAPGEDRLAGVETQETENGCPILNDALAYIECRVENRMECGDHWLIYAIAETGKVLQSQGITAVHHRKSGSFYT